MIEIQQEQERKVKCLLVGAPDKKNGNPEPKELQSLVQTLDMEIAVDYPIFFPKSYSRYGR